MERVNQDFTWDKLYSTVSHTRSSSGMNADFTLWIFTASSAIGLGEKIEQSPIA